MKGNMAMERKENISPAAFDSSAVVAGKQVLGGRKMVTKIDQDLSGKGPTGESPKKSENDKNASKESLGGHQHHLNNQNGKVSEAKITDFAQKDESYRVMEAINDREVMNLMRKDYKGMNKPRRNPPINNHKPTD